MLDRIINILLVEDDEIDVEAITRGFKKSKIANPFVYARDGVEALEILKTAGVPSPFLILLDLNMPRMNGIEFLEVLRSDPDLKRNIVFVLTTSNDDRDLWAAYQNNIAGYILKSQAGRDFSNVIKVLDVYWRYVEFPPDRKP